MTRTPILRTAFAGMAVAAAVLLAGCSNKPVPPCPQVRVDSNTARFVKFQETSRDLTQIVYAIEMVGYDGRCKFTKKGVDITMDLVFDVVAEPNRRRILEILRNGEASVGELVGALDISQPAVSKHLRVLRDAGLVDVTVDAQRRRYRLRPEPLMEIDEWLMPYRVAWRDRLDALERHLDQMPD